VAEPEEPIYVRLFVVPEGKDGAGYVPAGMMVPEEDVVEYRDALAHWLEYECDASLDIVKHVLHEALRDLNQAHPEATAQAIIDWYDAFDEGDNDD